MRHPDREDRWPLSDKRRRGAIERRSAEDVGDQRVLGVEDRGSGRLPIYTRILIDADGDVRDREILRQWFLAVACRSRPDHKRSQKKNPTQPRQCAYAH